MNKKAIALLSGGLDSTLALKLVIDQGIEVQAVHFTSIFCNCTPKKAAGCKLQARKVADELSIPVQVIVKGMDYIKMVEKPPHGHGSGMNPCIDCRIYMLRKVKDLMPELDASFVVTGEVLAQRPMSQHRNTLRLIEKESGLDGLILRPLSAQHFEPSLPEKEGLVDRSKLLNFSGRSRKPQFELALKLGITDYPCPAGGCLLTDKEIAARLRDLFLHVPDYEMADLHLLKFGRHFRLRPDLKIIVGRNQEENDRIRSLSGKGSTLLFPLDFRGPTVTTRGSTDQVGEMDIGRIIARYSQDDRAVYRIGKLIKDDEEHEFTVISRYPSEELNQYLITER